MRLNKSHNFATTVSKHVLKNKRIIYNNWHCQHFCSESKSEKKKLTNNFKQPPLSESLPNLPKAVHPSTKQDDQVTLITKLPNGLRVASENRFGQFCTVGVVINCGSRFEVAYPSGVSHFLEKLAFHSTLKYENKREMLQKLEQYGGICDCQSTRDAFIYAASVMRNGLDSAMDVISEAVLRPKILQEELTESQQTIQYELENLKSKPEQDLILTDMIHAAAYRDNTLGLPKICPEKNVYVIDRPTLYTYLKNYYALSRVVVAGVGVDHDELVDITKKYFVKLKATWEYDTSLAKTDNLYLPDYSCAQYTGGIVKEECEIPQFAGPSGLPELAHVVIGLEGTSYNHEDFIPLCVLNMMMGGGGSFSAGGPGKGMFSRLYSNVLNKYHWIFSATAYNHSYADSGLFCIHVSATPQHVGNMTEVIIKEMTAMGNFIHPEELSRAKKQLTSMLLMNLEAKPVIFEDMARQVLANGYRKNPEAFIEMINNVTTDDVTRVAQRLLNCAPAVAARGNISKLPSYDDIQSSLCSRPVKKSSRLSLF